MNKSKTYIFILSVLVTTPLLAHTNSSRFTKNSRIETVADIQHWCKHQSFKQLKREKMTPHNWTVKTIRTLNDFYSSGSWRVKNKQIDVTCSNQIGRKAKSTKIEITQ